MTLSFACPCRVAREALGVIVQSRNVLFLASLESASAPGLCSELLGRLRGLEPESVLLVCSVNMLVEANLQVLCFGWLHEVKVVEMQTLFGVLLSLGHSHFAVVERQLHS